MMASQALTGKQQAFCEAYVINGFNGVKAALSAGYCQNVTQSTRQNKLAVIASQNLTKLNISAEIARIKAETEYTVEDWRQDVFKARDIAIAQKNPQGICRATEQLGKHIGAFEKDHAQEQVGFKQLIQEIADKRMKRVESKEVPLLEQNTSSQQAPEGPNGS